MSSKERSSLFSRISMTQTYLGHKLVLSTSMLSMVTSVGPIFGLERSENEVNFFSRSPSTVALSHHRFLSILGLFPVTFSVFVFILLRFDSQSSLSAVGAGGTRSVG